MILVAGATDEGAPVSEEQLVARARVLRDAGRSARDAARVLTEEFGVTRNVAYRIAEAARSE